jgi:hypothetical protein
VLIGSAEAPDGVEILNHAGCKEHRPAARKLGVIHLAAPHDLVLQFPRQRGFRVFLDIARQHGIAASADGDVERGSGPSRIGERGRKAHLFHELLGSQGARHLAGAFAAPAVVTKLFDLVGDHRSWTHARPW